MEFVAPGISIPPQAGGGPFIVERACVSLSPDTTEIRAIMLFMDIVAVAAAVAVAKKENSTVQPLAHYGSWKEERKYLV